MTGLSDILSWLFRDPSQQNGGWLYGLLGPGGSTMTLPQGDPSTGAGAVKPFNPFTDQYGSPFANLLRGAMAGMAGGQGRTGADAIGAGYLIADNSLAQRRQDALSRLLMQQRYQQGQYDLNKASRTDQQDAEQARKIQAAIDAEKPNMTPQEAAFADAYPEMWFKQKYGQDQNANAPTSYKEWQLYQKQGGTLGYNDYMTMDANRHRPAGTTINMPRSEDERNRQIILGGPNRDPTLYNYAFFQQYAPVKYPKPDGTMGIYWPMIPPGVFIPPEYAAAKAQDPNAMAQGANPAAGASPDTGAPTQVFAPPQPQASVLPPQTFASLPPPPNSPAPTTNYYVPPSAIGQVPAGPPANAPRVGQQPVLSQTAPIVPPKSAPVQNPYGPTTTTVGAPNVKPTIGTDAQGRVQQLLTVLQGSIPVVISKDGTPTDAFNSLSAERYSKLLAQTGPVGALAERFFTSGDAQRASDAIERITDAYLQTLTARGAGNTVTRETALRLVMPMPGDKPPALADKFNQLMTMYQAIKDRVAVDSGNPAVPVPSAPPLPDPLGIR